MKKILTTAGYLGNANKALNYAIELAALSKGKVMILQASHVHVSNSALLRN